MGTRYRKSDASIGQHLYKHYTAAQGVTAVDSSTHGHFLSSVVINTLGTSLVITVQNGSDVIAVITPTQPEPFPYPVACDQGLKIGISGSGFDVTVIYDLQAV